MDGGGSRRGPRVALACPGVGLSQRGFERYFHDIFRLLEPDLDVTLFKGGGPATERERVLRFLPRNGRFVRTVPVHRLLGRTPIHVECMSYALALVPHLRGGRFDVVHTIDPPLTRVLYKLRKSLRMDFRLLYTHGVTMPPEDYPPADHAHHVAEGPHREALDAGFAPASMTVVPCGIYPERFRTPRTREEIRAEHGVRPETFVILSVAALNRIHKRVHHLIDEAARLQGDFILWLDASMDQGEPDLVDYARSRLGERVRLTHVPSARVGELYRMADVFAHASTFESFGLSIVEAAAMGLPVLIHDNPHFRWLVPHAAAWVDMTEPGALAGRLAAYQADRGLLRAANFAPEVLERFSWPNLKEGYRALYEMAAELPQAERPGQRTNYFSELHG